jgi:hypothetical protein
MRWDGAIMTGLARCSSRRNSPAAPLGGPAPGRSMPGETRCSQRVTTNLAGFAGHDPHTKATARHQPPLPFCILIGRHDTLKPNGPTAKWADRRACAETSGSGWYSPPLPLRYRRSALRRLGKWRVGSRIDAGEAPGATRPECASGLSSTLRGYVPFRRAALKR